MINVLLDSGTDSGMQKIKNHYLPNVVLMYDVTACTNAGTLKLLTKLTSNLFLYNTFLV